MEKDLKCYADLLEVLQQMTPEQLQQKINVLEEGSNDFVPIVSIEDIDEDVYVNMLDDEDGGTLHELYENHDGNFGDKDLENYRVSIPKGTLFMYSHDADE